VLAEATLEIDKLRFEYEAHIFTSTIFTHKAVSFVCQEQREGPGTSTELRSEVDLQRVDCRIVKIHSLRTCLKQVKPCLLQPTRCYE
jgi:hypothetical protein